MNKLNHTLNHLLNSDMSDAEKLVALLRLDFKKIIEVYSVSPEVSSDMYRDSFVLVANWLLALNEVSYEQVEQYCVLGKLLCAEIDHPDGWAHFHQVHLQLLTEQGRGEEAEAARQESSGAKAAVERASSDPETQADSAPQAGRLNNELYSGKENPDLAPSYLNQTKGLPIMNNIIDRNFRALITMMKETGSAENLTRAIIHLFHQLPDNKRNWYVARFTRNPLYRVRREDDVPELNLQALVQPRAEALFHHTDELVWLYERLANYRSRYTLFAFVHNWALWGDLLGRCGKLRDDIYKEYLDFDVLAFGKNEVYVDCGGYNGDSLRDYIEQVGKDSYKKIHVYEFDEINCDDINKYIDSQKLENVILHRKAVGLNGKLRYTPADIGGNRSGNTLSDVGEAEVDVVSLDDDVQDRLTYIKMDIEGSEYAALLGAKRHIQEEYPKLAICLYHKPNDIWEIPRLIDAMAPDYKFYLTFCGFPMDTVGMAMLAVKD